MVMKTVVPLATKTNTNDDTKNASANAVVDKKEHPNNNKTTTTKNNEKKKKTTTALITRQKEKGSKQEELTSSETNESLSTTTWSSSKAKTDSNATSTSTAATMTTENYNNNNKNIIVRDGVVKEIQKQVLRQKLSKLRHLVIEGGINPAYLDKLFPQMLENFSPQTVHYNGGIAQIKEWKISCYLEVMPGGVPCTNPNLTLLQLFQPLLDTCNDLFLEWYRQQHACNVRLLEGKISRTCKRIMTFITRYTPSPGEQALLKHVDGAGKVDGSVVVALPIDRWSKSFEENSFIGHGGGITFWDGITAASNKNNTNNNDDNDPSSSTTNTREIHYESRSGDIAFIDRAVWHQADPITKGTRWALVIFYDVETKLDS